MSNFRSLFFDLKKYRKFINQELTSQNIGVNRKNTIFWLFWKILYFHWWNFTHEFDHIDSIVVNRSNDSIEAWSSGLCVSSILLLLVATITNTHNALRTNVFLGVNKVVCSSRSFNLLSFSSRSTEDVFKVNANWFFFIFLSVKDTRTNIQYQVACIFHSIVVHIWRSSFVIFQKRTRLHICFTSQERWTVCFRCENLWTYISQFLIFSIKFLAVFRSSIHHAIWFLQISNTSWSRRAKVRNLLQTLVDVSRDLVWTSGSVLDWTSNAFRSYCNISENFWLHRSHCIRLFCLVFVILNSSLFCNIQDSWLFHTIAFLRSWNSCWSTSYIFKSFWLYRNDWFVNCDFLHSAQNHIVVVVYHQILSFEKT